MPSPIPIQRYMSPAPYIVADTHTLEYAGKIMEQHRIRHLPVLRSGRLVGVLSLEETRAALAAGGAKALVRDAMSPDTYAVAPDAPLEEVALEMADKRHAIAVVQGHGNVIGVFTTVDGLRALAALCQERAQPRPSTRGLPLPRSGA